MDMPKPGVAHKKLAKLAGKWVGKEIMHPGPMGPGGASEGTTDAKMSPDGFYLYANYKQKVGSKIVFHGHSVIGFDKQSQKYQWLWVDSMDMMPSTTTPGTFDGKVFHFEHDTPHGKMRYLYTLVGSARYKFKIESSGDGGATWTAFMEGDYKRVK